MLDLSPDKLLMLAVVALVVLGPNRLPGAARTLGRLIGQMRAMTSSLQSEVRDALHDPEEAFGTALADFRPSEVRRTVRRAVTDTLAPFDAVSSPGVTAAAVASNLAPGSGSAPGAAVGTGLTAVPPAAPVPLGWQGRPVPDDPGFN